MSHHRRRLTSGTLISLVLASGVTFRQTLTAQEQTLLADLGTHSFEVATIKPSRASGPSIGVGVPGRFEASGVTLLRLIAAAYGGTSGSLSATRIDVSREAADVKWIDSEKWDILAGLPDDADGIEPSLKMLQTLLRDRFRLRLHTELRTLPVYALVTNARDRRSLHRSDVDCAARVAHETRTAGPPPGGWCGWRLERGAVNTITAKGITLQEVAHRLSGSPAIGRVVVDRTNLNGTWDFELTFEPSPLPPADSAASVPTAPSAPSLVTAVEELGLKLEPTRGPVEVLVIDGAERPSND
jgi:uncharacterized protein (TIGR03435 family)